MVQVKSRQLFTGYRGQLFYASACIRTARHAGPVTRSVMLQQAETHLRQAMGCANLEQATGKTKGNILTALNHVRVMKQANLLAKGPHHV